MDKFCYWDEVTKDIVNTGRIFIYGAGLMGRALQHCLSFPPYSIRIMGFLIGDDNSKNPDNIEGIPVINISDSSIDRDALILVALHEKNLPSAMMILSSEKYTNIRVVSFDGNEWSHIRGNYLRSNKILNESCLFLDESFSSIINIYVVKSVFDKKINTQIPLENFEIPIQVGKALIEDRICRITDDEGENISEKNRQYCELTALYWIWKHKKAKLLGLCHYRRRFGFKTEQIGEILSNKIDMIVTLPILNLSGVGKQYGLDHSESDWNTMIDVIRNYSPEYYESALKVQSSIYYYGYNMFIARYEVFCDYCKWLFAILSECEKRIGKKDDLYQNRYIGYLAERLLNVYIVKNNLRLLVVDKNFTAS